MPKNTLIFIDNFDSFTYNIVHLFQVLGVDVKVIRNQELSVESVLEKKPRYLVLGPGPGSPKDAGITHDLIQKASGTIPLLGICLGHQAIGEAFGGQVVRAARPMHGKVSRISHNEEGLFQDIPLNFNAVRYHSLIVQESTLPSCLKITARAEDNEIMALQHTSHPTFGLQFHPESCLSDFGSKLLRNYLNLIF